MSSAIDVAVPRPGEPPLSFPARCAGCGGEPRTESTLVVTRFVASRRTGEQKPVQLRWQVPHCEACARATKATFLAQLLPFLAGFLVFGAGAFVTAWFVAARAGLDEMGPPERMYSLVVAAAAGLAGGLAGGLLSELAARLLLVPVFGRALLRAPLLVGTVFSDADYVVGVRARPSRDATEVTFTFTCDDVGHEFAAANAMRVTRR